MDFIKYTFNEDEWSVYLVDDEDDVLDLGNDAEVMHEKKEIYFRGSALRLNLIKHELWHVYIGYCYLDSAHLDMTQMEEVSSSLFADKGEAIVNKAKDIYAKLKQLRDGGV